MAGSVCPNGSSAIIHSPLFLRRCIGGSQRPCAVIATLGCRLNQTESEAIGRHLTDEGWNVSFCPVTAADGVMMDVSLVVVNTCAVTQKAEQKARRGIRLLLEKCPRSRVVVTGCYAALSKAEIESIDPRIEVIPKNEVASLGLHIIDSFPYTDTFIAHSRASLKVQDGCNGNCSFCTIHIARGKSVSLSVDEAIRRAQEIEARGYKEIALTGVNLGQWRGGAGQALSYLLRSLLSETDHLYFRLSSLHPDVIDDEFCRVVSNERIRPHFHLSVQSGSDKILKAMNRPYTRKAVLDAAALLRGVKDNPFLACDIIAGFPGESDEDATDTMSLCRECGFAHIHAFPFSPRPGTTAYSMRPYVPQSVAGQRVRSLEEMSKKGMMEYVAKCTGNVYSAIVEKSKMGDANDAQASTTSVRAVTENFLHVAVLGVSSGSRCWEQVPGAVARSSIPREVLQQGKRVTGADGLMQGDEVMVRITGHGKAGCDAEATLYCGQ